MTIYYSKNQVCLVEALPAHLADLAQHLRVQDLAELAASCPGRAEEALQHFAARSSVCLALLYQNRTAAVFGLAPRSLLGGSACVWSLTSKEVEKIPKTFFKLSKRVIDCWLEQYPELFNFTDQRYVRALDYVRRLGGEFGGESRYFGERRFLLFRIRRK